MLAHSYLAWLHWNPPRDLFTIPFIDRPVAIYGLWFVSGFIIGYFLLIWILREKLAASPLLSAKDIADWPALIKGFQKAAHDPKNPLHAVVQRLDHKLQKELMSLQAGQDMHIYQKEALLAALHTALQDPSSKLDKPLLESLIPKAFITPKEHALLLTDRLTWFIVLGTIIGARLGHVFFYDWPIYQNDWTRIFKVWEGGLASHGGVLGVLLAVFLYSRTVLKQYPEISLVGLLDCLVIPAGLVACFIRIGNFFNQEILGPPTSKPWGIVFEEPADHGAIVPRHPTQLYEAGFYFLIFWLILFIWMKYRPNQLRSGYLSGLFLILLFTGRFAIEFIKIPQSLIINESFLQMGQYLSIPFILLGCALFFFGSSIDRLISPSRNPSLFSTYKL